MISVVGLIIVMGIGGCFFALPVFIPSLRRQAQASPRFRYGLMASLSVIAFLVFSLGLTFLAAFSTKLFTVGALCGSNCVSQRYVFEDDQRRDFLLTQELWLHNMAPPFMFSDTACLTGDVAVCEIAHPIRAYGVPVNNASYLITLLVLLIPAASCALTLWYITRDDRKRKVKVDASQS